MVSFFQYRFFLQGYSKIIESAQARKSLFADMGRRLAEMDVFWNIFEKSGSIEAYITHKELERKRKRHEWDFSPEKEKDRKNWSI